MNRHRRTAFFASRFVSCGLFAFAVATTARAQSDSCGSATPIGTGAFFGSTVSASNDGSSSCGETTTSNDVWYRYTAADDGALQVTTCGSNWDTVLSLHSACPGNAGNELDCNDDSCNIQSVVGTPMTTGQSVLIRVAGWQGATGAFTLHVSFSTSPGTDTCANALPVVAGTTIGDTLSASNDGSANCGSSDTTPDVWYRFTATEDCRLRVNTCGSNDYDSVLSIHSGCPGTAANTISCNDDSCGTSSSVSTLATAGSTYWIRVSGYAGATGNFILNVSCDPPTGAGADILVGQIGSLAQYGRLADIIGCGMDSPLCNQGSEPLDWIANPDPRHPFATFGVYRIQGTRFEQIGQSWCKHGYGAGQSDACGLGCSPYQDETHLGVGCSDTYSSDNNAERSILGPRSEINPWTGAYAFAGSYLDLHAGDPVDPIEHRLRIHDSDIDPADNPGATYVGECHIVGHDDVNHLDSVGWTPVSPSGASGGGWSFGLGGTTNGTAIHAWPGAQLTTFQDAGSTDGRAYLGVVVTDNGNGTWHYDYAIQNFDMDRGIGSFRIPLGAETHVTNAGFHAPESDDPEFSNTPWSLAFNGDALTWSTESFASNPHANPIHWATAYSFRFDADSPPADTTVTLGLWKPGSPASLTGTTAGPRVGSCLAGTVNSSTGPIADVLSVNGSAGDPQTRVVTAARGSAVAVSLAAATQGPVAPRYGLWVWLGNPASAANLVASGQTLGCTVNPTPLQRNSLPQPFRCLRGGVPPVVCSGVTEIGGAPPRAPWTLHRNQGFATAGSFTLQGVLQDAGAGNSTGFSVTNAVVLVIQ
ncbi:MAG: hypothetical protein HYR85_15235 [Planctomycetes bacterium]|nr:hypothetical protein [Planctomycetota bacterium]MBI3844558.1 hypothetical protein [Planctomycetota bacterium]